MALADTIRSLIPLAIGLGVGGLGATLFQQSMPGPDGSPEARAKQLEVELQQARNRITTLEAGDARAARHRLGRSFTDGVRTVADDIRDGKPVSPDDLFRAAQPLLRDLAPLFDRMRLKQQTELIDRMTGELARKYNLSPAQQEALRQWFGQKAADNANKWRAMMAKDGTTLQDVMRATKDLRPDDGLDAFMANTLGGDKLSAFQADRLAERATRVQQDADTKVARLESIVQLDDAQRDRMFGIMARASRDYDPALKLEGVTGDIGRETSADRQQAILAILRPDQRTIYQTELQRRREVADKNMQTMGLTLPASWDPLDDP